MSKKGPILAFLTMFLIPSALAFDMDLGQPIGELGKFLSTLLSNKYAVYLITAILIYVLLYNLFSAALEKTHFGNSKGIAISLSLMADIALMGGGYFFGFQGSIDKLISGSSLFPSLLLAFIVFMLFKKWLKGLWALLLAGVVLLFLSGSMKSQSIFFAAVLCIAIFIIIKVFGHQGPWRDSKYSSGLKNAIKEKKKLEREERREEKNIEKEEKKEQKLEKEEEKELKEIAKHYKILVENLTSQWKDQNNAHVYCVSIYNSAKSLVEELKKFKEKFGEEENEIKKALQEVGKLIPVAEQEERITEREADSSPTPEIKDKEKHELDIEKGILAQIQQIQGILSGEIPARIREAERIIDAGIIPLLEELQRIETNISSNGLDQNLINGLYQNDIQIQKLWPLMVGLHDIILKNREAIKKLKDLQGRIKWEEKEEVSIEGEISAKTKGKVKLKK